MALELIVNLLLIAGGIFCFVNVLSLIHISEPTRP